MKKYFIFFLVFSASLVFGQNNIDTLNVVTLQDFSIPTFFHHVTKVNSLDIKVFKNTSNGLIELSSKNFAFDQTPTDRELKTLTDGHHGLGPSVQIIVDGFLNEIGDYKIIISLRSLGDFREPNLIKTKTFLVKVGYPKLITIGTLRTTYFWGDSATFSLAFTGLNNKDDFNYFILDKGTSDTLKKEMMTQIIKLDRSITNSEKVRGSTEPVSLNLILTYKNEIFNFIYLDETEPLPSNNFIDLTIERPTIEVMSLWSENENEYTPITLDNLKSLEFDFNYEGGLLEGMGYYKYITLEIPSDPSVKVLEGKNLFEYASKTRTDFKGTRIKLKINDSIYNTLETCGIYKSKIELNFITQFGQPVRKIFTARIYK